MYIIIMPIIMVSIIICYCFGVHIDDEYYKPYKRSLEPYSDVSSIYGKICESKGQNIQYKKYQQVCLTKIVLDEIFQRHPEKISISRDRIIYTLSEYDCYTILLPSRKDYIEFVKKFNEYINLKEKEKAERIEKENRNKILDDAYDVVR